MAVSLVFVAVALVIVASLLFIRARRVSINLPGPPGLPFIGNVFQLDYSKGVHHCLTEWSKKYGPVFKLKLLGKDIVVLNDYTSIYEVLLVKSSDFAGRPQSASYDAFLPNISLQDYDAEFKAGKKICQRGMRQYGDGMTRIVALAQREIERCIEEFRTHQGRGFTPNNHLQSMVLRIISTLVLGEDASPFKADDINRIIGWIDMGESLFESNQSFLFDIFPWLCYLGNNTHKGILEFKHTRDKQITEWIQTCQASEKSHEERALLHILLDEEASGTMPRKTTIGLVGDVFAAGVITTHSTLSVLFLVLLNHPDIKQKLHEEVDGVLGGRVPELADRQRMPYLEATLLEVLRYGSTAYMAIPHKTTTGTTISGVHMPEGTEVWTNLWQMHHDEAYFTKPYEFNPQHFLDDTGNVIPVQERKSFLPFGGGRRVCLGEVLAKARIFLFVARFLQVFDILPEDDNDIPSADMATFTPQFILMPPKFRLRLQERDIRVV